MRRLLSLGLTCLSVWAAGCTLITDIDRSAIPDNLSGTGSRDADVTDETTTDETDTTADTTDTLADSSAIADGGDGAVADDAATDGAIDDAATDGAIDDAATDGAIGCGPR